MIVILKPTEKWKLEGLKLVFSKRYASKIWRGVSEVRFKKNSTPSPWKRRKTTLSAIFCATSAWGLRSNFHTVVGIIEGSMTIFLKWRWGRKTAGWSRCWNCVFRRRANKCRPPMCWTVYVLNNLDYNNEKIRIELIRIRNES